MKRDNPNSRGKRGNDYLDSALREMRDAVTSFIVAENCNDPESLEIVNTIQPLALCVIAESVVHIARMASVVAGGGWGGGE